MQSEFYKVATDEEVEPIARKLKLACEGAGATFILDDRVELVKKLQKKASLKLTAS